MTQREVKTPWLVRSVFAIVGLLALGLGIVGAFLPLLPTTPLVILSAACFAKASPRLEAWLLANKTFGPMILDWRARRAIPLKAKVAASAGTTLGFVVFYVTSSPPLWLAGIVLCCLVAITVYVVTRPQ